MASPSKWSGIGNLPLSARVTGGIWGGLSRGSLAELGPLCQRKFPFGRPREGGIHGRQNDVLGGHFHLIEGSAVLVAGRQAPELAFLNVLCNWSICMITFQYALSKASAWIWSHTYLKLDQFSFHVLRRVPFVPSMWSLWNMDCPVASQLGSGPSFRCNARLQAASCRMVIFHWR